MADQSSPYGIVVLPQGYSGLVDLTAATAPQLDKSVMHESAASAFKGCLKPYSCRVGLYNVEAQFCGRWGLNNNQDGACNTHQEMFYITADTLPGQANVLLGTAATSALESSGAPLVAPIESAVLSKSERERQKQQEEAAREARRRQEQQEREKILREHKERQQAQKKERK